MISRVTNVVRAPRPQRYHVRPAWQLPTHIESQHPEEFARKPLHERAPDLFGVFEDWTRIEFHDTRAQAEAHAAQLNGEVLS